jgi:hypothetical protein
MDGHSDWSNTASIRDILCAYCATIIIATELWPVDVYLGVQGGPNHQCGTAVWRSTPINVTDVV